MNEILMIYLYSIWGNFEHMLAGVTFVTITITIVAGFLYLATFEEKKVETTKAIKKYILIKTTIVLIILNVLIPSKNIMLAMMVATPVIEGVQKIAKSEKLDKVEKILDLALDKSIKKLGDSLKD